MTMRLHRGALALPALCFLILAGCVQKPGGNLPMLPPAKALRPVSPDDNQPPLPPMKTFGAVDPVAPKVSNADLQRDFIDLTMKLESGKSLPVFTRFEGPIRIQVKGTPPATMMQDLTQVVTRLQKEAGLDIAIQPAGKPGNVVMQVMGDSDIQQQLPGAACFVVPGISDLTQYRSAQRRGLTDWSRLKKRQQILIALPGDQPPQELRDCLNEELAQALGPLDDLFRLDDSTFNDDNIHSILTGYDMLILRIAYAPELHSGMTSAQVQAALPAILKRLNPQGEKLKPVLDPESTPEWRAAMNEAIGNSGTNAARRRAAEKAVKLAKEAGWKDNRLAFALYTLARLEQARDPDQSLADLSAAHRIYMSLPDTRLHEATTATQLAVFALASGAPDAAMQLLQGRDAVALQYQNAALLAGIGMLKARAWDMLGDPTRAKLVLKDTLGWARYGFGSAGAVRAQLQQVETLGQDSGSDGSSDDGKGDGTPNDGGTDLPSPDPTLEASLQTPLPAGEG